jgi:hypothetical protein
LQHNQYLGLWAELLLTNMPTRLDRLPASGAIAASPPARIF